MIARLRSLGGWVLESRFATALAGAYLVVFLAAFLLPLLTGEALAGLWAYLLALPWSDALPVTPLERVDARLTGILSPALIFAGGVLNALLLYLGTRWIETRLRGRRRGQGGSHVRSLQVVLLGAATLAAAPVLVMGVYQVGLLVSLFVFEGSSSLARSDTVGLVVLLSLAGVAGLAGLWATVLGSPSRWSRRRLGAVTLAILLGLGASVWLLVTIGDEIREMGTWTAVYWSIVLLLPLGIAVPQIVRVGRAWKALGKRS